MHRRSVDEMLMDKNYSYFVSDDLICQTARVVATPDT